MSLRLLYPSDPLNPKKPDEIYAAEHAAAKRLGTAVSVFELETLDASGLKLMEPLSLVGKSPYPTSA